MLVNHYNRNIKVAMFEKPDGLNGNHQVHVCYQKSVYNRLMNSNKINENSICLNDEFENIYNTMIVDALINPDKILNNIPKKYRIILNGIFLDENSLLGEDEIIYKYRCQDYVYKNKYNVNDGVVSFLNPNLFNDPFDCNCTFNNSVDMSDLFKIFCVFPNYDDILMWSYYGNDHKGYCFGYSKNEIIKTLINQKINGVCIVGNVTYNKNRPAIRSGKNTFSYSEMKFYIDASFTKYSEWSNEKEYRFVIISDDFNLKNNNYFEINTNIYELYMGCKSDDTIDVFDSDSKILKRTKLEKHPTEYKLIK